MYRENTVFAFPTILQRSHKFANIRPLHLLPGAGTDGSDPAHSADIHNPTVKGICT